MARIFGLQIFSQIYWVGKSRLKNISATIAGMAKFRFSEVWSDQPRVPANRFALIESSGSSLRLFMIASSSSIVTFGRKASRAYQNKQIPTTHTSRAINKDQ